MNETALRPVHMNIGIYGNGDYDGKRKPFPSVYIDDALSQNILYYSYEKPCTIEELAKLCGVPAYYVEDRINHLLKYEAMVEATKGKYQTDFIIWSDKYGIYCEENAEKALMPIMDGSFDRFERNHHAGYEARFLQSRKKRNRFVLFVWRARFFIRKYKILLASVSVVQKEIRR